MSPPSHPVRRMLVVGTGVDARRLCQAGEELGIEGHAVEGAPEALVRRALELHCDAVHPGALCPDAQRALAEACRQAGLRFLGAEPRQLAAMSDPLAMRQLMHEAGLPLATHPGRPPLVRLSLLADAQGQVLHLPPRQRLPDGTSLSPLPWLTPERARYLGHLAAQGVAARGVVGLVEACFQPRANALGFVSLVPGPTGEEALDETLTGLDPLAEQLRLGQGERLRVRQSTLGARGHARLWRLTLPAEARLDGGPGLRLDHPGDGGEARLVVWGRRPEEVVARARRGLAQLVGESTAEGLVRS